MLHEMQTEPRHPQHTLVGFANPYLVCDTCKKKVRYWHNSERCGCDEEYYNHPCLHRTGVSSICPSWSPVGGCLCEDKENHDR